MNLNVLKTLVDLTKQQSKAAATALAKELAALNDAKEKVHLLENYLDDYRLNLQQQMLIGIKASELHNSQNFIQQLELAIRHQEKSVEKMNGHDDLAKKNWQECEKKTMSFETLMKRSLAKIALVEARIDQKNNDEFASRKYAMQRLL